ncbi:riboflavin biosynthesis protein RibF [Halobacteriovorax marinus]|uniref:Riboflavin biosynthesis protein n=1 Tax=Halobacteriovorax marinus TaxID=97084 RepID=A0A1Y5F5L7_9BACT|nr:riboflavin biosynthesis protein RibF [Halobacteriovorax marinus]
MKKIDSLNDILQNDFAITIGNFDGVHLGHQQIIQSIAQECKESNLKFVLITFNPHPLQILRPRENFLLNLEDEKYNLLSDLGIDFFYEIPFSRDLSTLSPEDFLNQYILENSHVKRIYMGHDFAFGANKKGDFSFVKRFCTNLSIVKLEEFKKVEKNISSTIIRNLIIEGDVEESEKLLGRPFFLRGTVVKGAERGRQIGFPTANINYGQIRITPKLGVYVTTVEVRGEEYHSITNVGLNPTFKDDSVKTVETNIFDFDDDIYGEVLTINFHKRLRDEKKFNGINELVEQITKDVVQAKIILKEEKK